MDAADLQKLHVDVTVDCEGEICPEPVLKSMDALNGVESGQVVVLLTDLEVATQNVSVAVEAGQLAEVLGTLQEDGLFKLFMKKQ